MKEKNLGELTNAGINRYVDRHGRTLLVNRKKKMAYIIDKNAQKKEVIFSNRYILAIVVGILVGTKNVYLGVGLGVVIAVVLEVAYHMYYLKSLNTIELDELPEKFSFVNNAMKQTPGRNLSVGVIGLAIPVLLVINAIQTVKDWQAVLTFKDINNSFLVITSIAMGGFAGFIGYVCLNAYFAQRKEGK